jgi:hypothetical protein
MNHEAVDDTRDRLKAAGVAASSGPLGDALYGAVRVDLTDRPPALHDQVHYVAYGTPGGEYPRACRAAIVTGVGAWLDDQEQEPSNPYPNDGAQRIRQQTYHADAASLTVHNPTGMFLNVCAHDQAADPHGGTWHYPGDHCHPGGTR